MICQSPEHCLDGGAGAPPSPYPSQAEQNRIKASRTARPKTRLALQGRSRNLAEREIIWSAAACRGGDRTVCSAACQRCGRRDRVLAQPWQAGLDRFFTRRVVRHVAVPLARPVGQAASRTEPRSCVTPDGKGKGRMLRERLVSNLVLRHGRTRRLHRARTGREGHGGRCWGSARRPKRARISAALSRSSPLGAEHQPVAKQSSAGLTRLVLERA